MVRKCAVLLTAVLLSVFALYIAAPDAAAAYDESRELSDIALISRSDGGSVTQLLDGDYTTRRSVNKDLQIRIDCPENIQGLYVIWHTVPGEWSMLLDGEEKLCGQDGFLHEYVPANGARSVLMNMPQEDVQLCDIYIFGEGRLPDWVQVWQKPYEQADLLAVATHADDELLFFGGILPTYSREYGYKVQVAYLTNHAREPVRNHELLCGLWTCGITAYPVIGPFEDYNALFERYSFEQFEEYEVQLLRRFKPAAVVVQALSGEYGHVTHILGCKAMMSAAELAADSTAYDESAVRYGIWELPKLYVHMYEEGQLVMDWHVPMRTFDGQIALEVVKKGYLCHKSQQELVFQVSEEGNGDCRLFGLYRSTVGEDTTADLMENTGIIRPKGLVAALGRINE